MPRSGGPWNAEAFAAEYAQEIRAKNYPAVKALLAEVSESNYQLRDMWQVPRTVSVSSSDCAKFRRPGGKEPKVSFSELSTADALYHFAKSKKAVCGLNFANGSPDSIGGGYKKGATAQEEDLCRRIPSLFPSLLAVKETLYPFGPATLKSIEQPGKYCDVLYTAGLMMARTGVDGGFAVYPPDEQVEVSILSAAAPNINFASEVDDPELIYNTIKNIFIAPKLVQQEVSVLVLGAWGCGAFGGDPAKIAPLFAKALVQENIAQGLYEEVHFAILKVNPEDKNYDAFRAAFEQSAIRIHEL
mmetsp:Transcript_71242/g.154833  ORF Transcript_71242/g.154833 Transcript_71242/m.154833 type:complete len:301 (+) Transcript_71242:54-956(+)